MKIIKIPNAIQRLGKKFLSGPIILLLLVGAFGFFLRNDLRILLQISPKSLLLLSLYLFLFFALAGYIQALLLRVSRIRLSVFETVGLSYVVSLGNYLGPAKIGTLARAGYLKKAHSLPFIEFAGITVMNGFLALCSTGIIGLLLASGLYFSTGLFSTSIWIFCISCTLVSVVFGSLAISNKTPLIFSNHHIRRLLDYIRELLLHPRIWALGLFLIGLQQGLSGLIIQQAYLSVGIHVDIFHSILIGLLTALSNYASITPNNLGLQEAVMISFSQIVAIPAKEAALCSLVVRGIHLGLTLFFGPIFAFFLFKGKNLLQVRPGRAGQVATPEA